ncbi:hypothetical protein PF001_g31745 [Phytophthora fragariae]|uniref:Uncharacterized protein n=1 Tax=Phytophthora fragariae TaxID=53985 RepID=A0A6A4ASR5_9STRA|nr:hypothetical protein PF009_g28295 [Phytophthora fragariae]KAE8969475.1 hypothetical protein PF011_g26787 [Phytophthora fragariae]KAE9060772.1 hypothetical protein PF006_g31569 [Phytophthora fragariae]KAE9161022.1 hypothetical protein PF004_g30973 [Phytophthora fragariae]KAE9263285.1 hypothetical protein PF001_g31745 [Phytophthora fragariae]
MRTHLLSVVRKEVKSSITKFYPDRILTPSKSLVGRSITEEQVL